MRLKELHIRNIASIEQADIDFEHGLNDAVTGTPASIFLIAGDTGVGKSVILDSISLALYKTTPRVVSVANVNNNRFTNDGGEQIRVNCIEQYTRLGISFKDECYSEVSFEGNDGRDYSARLELGLVKSRTKNAAGEYVQKYETPKWLVKTGNGDWTKDNVEQTIRQAVGLSFQQFGRMAMLAQGQFANFLTGDKKEREAILEQLTNTEHFTDYGRAIESLAKQAKEALAQIQVQYDTEKPHTLTDDELQQLSRERQEALSAVEACDKAIKELDERVRLTDSFLTNERIRTEAAERKRELEALTESEDYRRSTALIADWDTTTTQRQQLADLRRAEQELAKARAGQEQAHDSYRLLAADLADRQAKAKAQAETAAQLRQWLSQRSQHEPLFKQAGEAVLKMQQHFETEKKIGGLNTQLQKEQGKTDALRKAADEALAAAREAAKAVAARQEEIDRLNQRRAALKPQAVIDELRTLYARKLLLTDLLTNMGNLKPMADEQRLLKADLEQEEQRLQQLRAASHESHATYEQQKQAADAAAKRLTTMEMSLDKKIKELRHRLYDEHTANCPLCGQHIQHICLDDDFKNMLTPLEEEQRKAAQALAKATEQRDAALGELKQLDGVHSGKLKQLADVARKMERAQQLVNSQATQAGLSPDDELPRQIAEATALLTANIDRLEAAQREAERLQSDINALQEAKKPFDDCRTKADRQQAKAENDVKNNAAAISQLEQSQSDLRLAAERLSTEISTLMKGYCDDWQKEADTLSERLKKDAREFATQQERLNEATASQERAATLTAVLRHYGESIRQACLQWDDAPAPRPYPCTDINAEWTRLMSSVTALAAKEKDCQATIGQRAAQLADYYAQTGKTAETLRELMEREAQVGQARSLVNDTRAQLKSRADAIAEAGKQMDAALAALGVADRSALPDRGELAAQKSATSSQRDEALAKMAQADSRIATHRANIKRLKEIEEQLEQARQRHVRWERLYAIFGGTRFRTLVQTYILRPLLNNANIYLMQITDRYRLTCCEENEQLSILVLDRYNKDQVRSVTVLSGGERFMISLALSLALSSLNRPDMNVNILFIDEGFGTLDEHSLDAVMSTLEKLQEIAGQSNRRVGIISHREELAERIPVKIQVVKKGEGRSRIEVTHQA